MTQSSAPATPRLMKERQRHTYYFLLFLIPLVIFQIGMFSDEGFLHETMDWLGYFLIPFAVLGRAYCTCFIGGKKNEEVMDLGPYSVVRNPLYVFSFIGVVGIGLESASPLFFAVLVGAFLFYYPKVVRHEEQFLAHKFGEPYRDYMSRVPRWIPDFSKWHEPEFVRSQPKLIRKTMLDACIFFLPMPIFELLELAHAKGAFAQLLGGM